MGFRLKRLIVEDTYGGWLRAHLYGAVLSAGPWLLSICTLGTLALLSRNLIGDAAHARFQVVVVYTYTFSLITTGAAHMVVTRQLADELYLGRLGALVVSYRWTIGVTALAHLLLGVVVYGLAPGLDAGTRLFGVMLLVVVSCTWMVMIFLGAAQDYASVVAAFFVGNAVSLLAALGLGRYVSGAGYLGGFLLGQAGILFVLCGRVEREFTGLRVPETVDLRRAFAQYPELIVTGLLYNAAIAVDRVLFWAAPTGRSIVGWFHASLYDTPIFLCYLSVVPSLAIFLVSVETDFYDRYREYYGVATKHGTLRQVLQAKRAMTDCLRDSVRRLLLAQAPVTLLLMAMAPWIAAGLGMERLQLGILRCGLVGAFLHALCLFGGIVLLYFDRRRAAAEVAGVFFLANGLFTAATLLVGPRAYGLGYPLAALLACAWSYRRLEETLEDLEYLTFAAQPLAPEAVAVESSHSASA
ncbi:MAG TPA: exopolysaccharide Pel transporter PelG [Methylomirabilota bacterium]|nr:exopolysaccharide Pel transporter PelG [Methylomirabilota bacterium]